MNSYPPYTIFPLGDGALLIDFGNIINEEINKKVFTLYRILKRQNLPFIIDLVPAYSSLAVYYNISVIYGLVNENTVFDIVAEKIENLLNDGLINEEKTLRSINIPVCYSGIFAPDLDELANKANLSNMEVIEIHSSTTYRVYMLGFLPGFAYMGKVDERIEAPRRNEPRKNLAPGSVGIAGRQTGIYPFESPGGWQIIGRTPIRIFDTSKSNPVLFEPGDEVKFFSISEDEFSHY